MAIANRFWKKAPWCRIARIGALAGCLRNPYWRSEEVKKARRTSLDALMNGIHLEPFPGVFSDLFRKGNDEAFRKRIESEPVLA